MSSRYARTAFESNPERQMSIIRWYDAAAFDNPYGVTLNSNFPAGIEKAVFFFILFGQWH